MTTALMMAENKIGKYITAIGHAQKVIELGAEAQVHRHRLKKGLIQEMLKYEGLSAELRDDRYRKLRRAYAEASQFHRSHVIFPCDIAGITDIKASTCLPTKLVSYWLECIEALRASRGQKLYFPGKSWRNAKKTKKCPKCGEEI